MGGGNTRVRESQKRCLEGRHPLRHLRSATLHSVPSKDKKELLLMEALGSSVVELNFPASLIFPFQVSLLGTPSPPFPPIKSFPFPSTFDD